MLYMRVKCGWQKLLRICIKNSKFGLNFVRTQYSDLCHASFFLLRHWNEHAFLFGVISPKKINNGLYHVMWALQQVVGWFLYKIVGILLVRICKTIVYVLLVTGSDTYIPLSSENSKIIHKNWHMCVQPLQLFTWIRAFVNYSVVVNYNVLYIWCFHFYVDPFTLR